MTAYESATARLLPSEHVACALIQDLLPLYIEDEVSPDSRSLIAEHVAGCERCAGYLAGTQSALAQLHRDRTAHLTTLARDTPNRRGMDGSQRIVTAIATLTMYGAGLIASLLLWHALSNINNLMELLFGWVVGFVSLAALLALAHNRSPLTLPRVLALLGSCGVALVGTFGFVANGHGGQLTIGLLLWAAGLAGVWAAVGKLHAAQSRPEPAREIR